jgi:hypothetical protein
MRCKGGDMTVMAFVRYPHIQLPQTAGRDLAERLKKAYAASTRRRRARD